MAVKRREWSDAEMLTVLEMRAGGATAAVIGRRFGVSRSAILGVVHRIESETDICFPPGDREGTFAPDWWQAGLAARGEAAA